MALVTIQLIEGLERGQVYSNLSTPVTIGREDDNVIQLNDERVSRFHAKIQEDDGRLILTDLDSTNGTRVNGNPIQMRVLQPGDHVSIGRCLLIFGSKEDIEKRFSQSRYNTRGQGGPANQTVSAAEDEFLHDDPVTSHAGTPGASLPGAEGELQKLFPEGAPPVPTGLKPLQLAQISDLVAYVHEQIRIVVQTAYEDANQYSDAAQTMCIDWPYWQQLLQLERELAVCLKRLAEPEN
jgi:pSer/pThr/pTyr-binding forkhead associated (FHA) protein